MRRQRKKYYIGLAALMSWILLSGTLHAEEWKVSGTALNRITLSSFGGKIREEYEIPKPVMPGSSVNKKVYVKNTGNLNMLVRVQVEKQFGTRDAGGRFYKDDSLDPEMIHIHFHQKLWKQIGDSWYYTEILKPGTETREPLMDSYTLDPKMDNRYQNKEAEISVKLECIQADAQNLSVWGVSERQIGITFTENSAGKDASVTFTKNREISFSDDGDLFPKYKNVAPGGAYQQVITITNQADIPVTFSLKAEETEQPGKTVEDQLLAVHFLEKESHLKLKAGSDVLYEGMTDGNFSGKGASMKEGISLGKLAPGETKELEVLLNTDKAIQNAEMNLEADVKWILEAEGETKNTEEGTAPKTGDDTNLFTMIILLLASLVIFLSVIAGLRRDMKEE